MKSKADTSCIWLLYSLIAFCLLQFAGNAGAGIYTSTKHGTSANRSVIPFTSGYAYTTLGHCGQCHEQHASFEDVEFTPPPGEGPTLYSLFQDNYGANSNELCYSCHENLTIAGMTATYGAYGIYQGKIKYDASVHNTSANMVWGLDASPDSIPPGPPYDDAGNCHNCHNPHGYDDGSGTTPIQQMLFAADGTTYEFGCAACHDGTQATDDVMAQFAAGKTYKHPLTSYSDRHTLPENGTSFETRHAECVDCHNPHTVLGGTHTAQTDGNAVSNVLKYVWGVEPTWPSIWTEPVTFTVRKPPTYTGGALYEYQICFKCHSGYGLGTITDGVTAITGPSGTSITDQAWEFNLNNKAAHPVVVTLNNQTGSYAPEPLRASQLKSPWNTGCNNTIGSYNDFCGDNTMYCSDCHGADNEATGAKGPHGSSRKYMLKGTGQYWPANSSGSLWTWTLMTDDTGDTIFCKNCHPLTDSNDTFADHGRSQHDVPCVRCHIAVPHGSKRSRLIGYVSEPAPYDESNQLGPDGFKKAASYDDYSQDNCYVSHADCISKHPDESVAIGGYDP